MTAALLCGLSQIHTVASGAQEPPAASAEQARIAELEAQLAAALARIAQLEAELEAAKAASPGGSGAPPSPPTAAPAPAAEDAGEPQEIHSVGQFFDLVKAEYALAFPALEAGERPETGPAFKRSIERFAISINRAWRQPIRWTAILRKATRGPDGTMLTVQPLRADGSPLGDEVTVRVDTIRNRRLDAILQKARMNDIYVINGLFIPKISANADRLTEGVFNNPPFVGPGIEFRYEITVDGLALAKEPVAAEPTAPATR
jgi:hypothetical protein